MEEMARTLNANNIPFIWLVFTNETNNKHIDNFIFMQPRLDIDGFVKEADYLVQLSDTEGFAYSIVKSLMLKTPVIVTNFPVTKEMGIVDGKNGYILDMELSNLDVNRIYNEIPVIDEYKHKESSELWLKEVLGSPSKSDYKYKRPKGTEVEVLIPTFYSVENKDCKIGDRLFIIDPNRLKQLLGDNTLRKQFVRVI